MKRHLCLLAVGLLFVSLAMADEPQTSLLWGLDGQAWEATGRLPDFSYAGYHRGERPLPKLEAGVSVKDFGATGDGQTDDTAAFQRALREAPGKVIGIPAGRYVITDILEIDHSHTVLQGAGPGKTTLYMPTPLENIRPNMGATTSGQPTSNYSWSGGIVWARGEWSGELLTTVTAPAKRGTSTLVVQQPARLNVGDEVRLVLQDDGHRTLTSHLYAGDPGNFDELRSPQELWIARVVKVDLASGHVELDRPLRTDVRLEWKPTLFTAQASVEEVGVEHLAFEFPVTPYKGHFTELGFNAIAMNGVRNCWIQDVEIRHADSGIFLSGANNTVADVTWISDRERSRSRNGSGHHGITLGGVDQLFRDFDFRTKFLHDITVTRGSAGNVARDGRGEDLNFDHHKYANHANLFTNIDAGAGTNIFMSGGGAHLGRHCGAWTTWWNIRTEWPIAFPDGWATDMITIVGVRSNKEAVTDADGRWFEPIPPERLSPVNLHESQLRRRLGTTR